jgi:hypothetical protein
MFASTKKAANAAGARRVVALRMLRLLVIGPTAVFIYDRVVLCVYVCVCVCVCVTVCVCVCVCV